MLRLAPDLRDDARPLIEPQVGGTVAHRQKARALGADIDEDGIEPRGPPHDPAEMDAARRRRVASLDIQLHRGIAFDPRGTPFAGPGGYQQDSGQTRYPRPASSCAVSYNGSPTTFE